MRKELLEDPCRQRGRVTIKANSVAERGVGDLLDESASGQELAGGIALTVQVDLNILQAHEPCVMRFG